MPWYMNRIKSLQEEYENVVWAVCSHLAFPSNEREFAENWLMVEDEDLSTIHVVPRHFWNHDGSQTLPPMWEGEANAW